MRMSLVSLSLLAGSAAVAAAQSPQSAPRAAQPHAIVSLPDAITWMPGPPSLPAGAQFAVLEGDPSKPGEFTMRLSMPDGYRIAPHSHPATEHVTVLEGTFLVGMGETWDAARMKTLPAGTFAALAPGVRHFALAKGRTVLQLHGQGPWRITYVNAADDPRNKGTSSER